VPIRDEIADVPEREGVAAIERRVIRVVPPLESVDMNESFPEPLMRPVTR
jgi:hypothetical protein